MKYKEFMPYSGIKKILIDGKRPVYRFQGKYFKTRADAMKYISKTESIKLLSK